MLKYVLYLLGWTKVRFFVSCVASEHSPIKVKDWQISKDIWVRAIPGKGDPVTFLEPGIAAFIVANVEHLIGEMHRSVQQVHVHLDGTISPYVSDQLISRFKWIREPYAR